jgi:drug/metabolite transporter (DMT)-like permease
MIHKICLVSRGMIFDSALLIAAEAAMALYPILIKSVPTNLTTQVMARVLTYTIVAFIIAPSALINKTWGSLEGSATSMSLGLLILFHIFSSYVAFTELPAGAAMSIFYTYPIWNMVTASLLHGESISFIHFLLVMVAFAGVILIAKSHEKDEKTKDYGLKGIVAGLGAALSETTIYFAVKRWGIESSYNSLIELYPGAFLLLAGFLLLNQEGSLFLDKNPEIWKPLMLFNLLVGVVGFFCWSYAIPRVTTTTFSLLSFFGVVSGFLWGWLFLKEVPSLEALAGAGLIVGAAGASYLV